MKARLSGILFALALAGCDVPEPTGPAAWNQFRGQARDGRVDRFEPPESWPERPERVWRSEIGEGYGSPVFGAGSIFVLTRAAGGERLSAIDPRTGEARWQREYPVALDANRYARSFDRGPFASPAVAEGVVVTLGVAGELRAFDADDGTPLWQRERPVSTEGLFTGSAGSPLIAEGVVYAHLGDDGGGAIVALDLVDGALRWRHEGDGPGYASPLVAELDGVAQLITLTDRRAVALDVDDGSLLWSVPFEDEWNENIVTPLVVGEQVLIAGARRGLRALRPRLGADGFTVETSWADIEQRLYMSSPLTDGAVVYAFSLDRNGYLYALDPVDGRVLWSGKGDEGRHASLVLAGELLFVLNDRGELRVLRPDAAGADGIAEYVLAHGSTWSHPLLLDERRLVVKDRRHLTLWRF